MKKNTNVNPKRNKTDTQILNFLVKNSQMSYRDIAKKIGVSAVTVMKRIHKLEKEGIIKGYNAKLDYQALGYDILAIIQLKISKGKLFEVENRIATHNSVFAIYDIIGPFDALLLGRFKSTAHMDGFLKEIQKYNFVEKTETILVLNQIKDGAVLVE